MNEPTTERPNDEPPTTLLEGDAAANEPEDDVEGHNLMAAELARTVEREHRAEADRAEAAGRRRRELKRGRSLRDRLFGR